MTTAIIGNLDSFQEGQEKITEYLDRVEPYFATNDIANEKNIPVVL